MTKVIELYGSPGVGKSTLAAEIYFMLKTANTNVELVRECAKDFAWAGKALTIYDQYYITGMQASQEASLYSKVDYIITDSPLYLGSFYMRKYHGVDFITPTIKGLTDRAKIDGIERYSFLLNRNKPYNKAGRYQTEKEAREIDSELETFLNSINLQYTKLDMPDNLRASFILSKVFT